MRRENLYKEAGGEARGAAEAWQGLIEMQINVFV